MVLNAKGDVGKFQGTLSEGAGEFVHDRVDVFVEHLLAEEVAMREEVQEDLLRGLGTLQKVELILLDPFDAAQQFDLVLPHVSIN